MVISEQEYLATQYEHEPEWIDGEVVERSMPDWPHSKTQSDLASLIPRRHSGVSLWKGTELRVKISGRHRVIDFCVFAGEEPKGRPPSGPPVIAVEILSPDDSMSKLIDKFQEYKSWGVKHVWLIDPDHKQFYTFDGELRPVPVLSLPEYGISITQHTLFSAGR